jgi:hypothetical protein
MWYVELCWFDKRRIIHPLKRAEEGWAKLLEILNRSRIALLSLSWTCVLCEFVEASRQSDVN